MVLERFSRLAYLPVIVGLLSCIISSVLSQAFAANITITTNPAALQISVDGTLYTAPQTFIWGAGTQHTIAVSSPQGSGSTRRLFSSWSDGGAVSHTIIVGGTDVVYTANFSTHYLLSTTSSPASGGSVAASPTSADGFYSSGTVVQLTAVPNTGYGFSTWSGDATGSTSPTTITMSAPRSVAANFASSVNLTISTNPPGLLISVDGTTYAAPQTFGWTIGTQHTISAPTPQVSGSTRNVFSSWSDGMALTHLITVPASPVSYTAVFTTQYLLTMTCSPIAGGSIGRSPSSADGYYDAGTPVQLIAYEATDYTFTGWAGDAGGMDNPVTIRMSGGRSVTATFSKTSGVEEEANGLPETIQLLPNFPNPFNPATSIRFQLPAAMNVRLEVFDPTGRLVATLVQGRKGAGYYEVPFDASSLSSGVYLCKLQAGDVVEVRKLVLIR